MNKILLSGIIITFALGLTTGVIFSPVIMQYFGIVDHDDSQRQKSFAATHDYVLVNMTESPVYYNNLNLTFDTESGDSVLFNFYTFLTIGVEAYTMVSFSMEFIVDSDSTFVFTYHFYIELGKPYYSTYSISYLQENIDVGHHNVTVKLLSAYNALSYVQLYNSVLTAEIL